MTFRDRLASEMRSTAKVNKPSGTVMWRSPSNIALVKYWGKHRGQIPMNPSVSLTLNQAYTDMSIEFEPKNGPSNAVDLIYEFKGKPREDFAQRIIKYLESIQDVCPFVQDYVFRMKSDNSFPHSAGIASSASAFSALALCLATIEDLIYENLDDIHSFRRKASFLARLGSGSACRSIYAHGAWWGQSNALERSHNEYAVDLDDHVHPVYQDMHDAILIISSDEKSVSSSQGHQLMNAHAYKEDRIRQASRHLEDILLVLQNGDLEGFGNILEREALALHGLMMSSYPGYILINGDTIDTIHEIQHYRLANSIPMYFTLDAGPNIHLLYPDAYRESVHPFLESLIGQHVEHIIQDQVGGGPEQKA